MSSRSNNLIRLYWKLSSQLNIIGSASKSSHSFSRELASTPMESTDHVKCVARLYQRWNVLEVKIPSAIPDSVILLLSPSVLSRPQDFWRQLITNQIPSPWGSSYSFINSACRFYSMATATVHHIRLVNHLHHLRSVVHCPQLSVRVWCIQDLHKFLMLMRVIRSVVLVTARCLVWWVERHNHSTLASGFSTLGCLFVQIVMTVLKVRLATVVKRLDYLGTTCDHV